MLKKIRTIPEVGENMIFSPYTLIHNSKELHGRLKSSSIYLILHIVWISPKTNKSVIRKITFVSEVTTKNVFPKPVTFKSAILNNNYRTLNRFYKIRNPEHQSVIKVIDELIQIFENNCWKTVE